MADDKQKKQENQKFNKWIYIFFGCLFFVYAFKNQSADGIDQTAIYSGIALIIFAFLGDIKKMGWFSARSGSVVEKLLKKLYPGEEPPKKNDIQKKK